MKAVINGVVLEGSPAELVTYQVLLRGATLPPMEELEEAVEEEAVEEASQPAPTITTETVCKPKAGVPPRNPIRQRRKEEVLAYVNANPGQMIAQIRSGCGFAVGKILYELHRSGQISRVKKPAVMPTNKVRQVFHYYSLQAAPADATPEPAPAPEPPARDVQGEVLAYLGENPWKTYREIKDALNTNPVKAVKGLYADLKIKRKRVPNPHVASRDKYKTVWAFALSSTKETSAQMKKVNSQKAQVVKCLRENPGQTLEDLRGALTMTVAARVYDLVDEGEVLCTQKSPSDTPRFALLPVWQKEDAPMMKRLTSYIRHHPNAIYHDLKRLFGENGPTCAGQLCQNGELIRHKVANPNPNTNKRWPEVWCYNIHPSFQAMIG